MILLFLAVSSQRRSMTLVDEGRFNECSGAKASLTKKLTFRPEHFVRYGSLFEPI